MDEKGKILIIDDEPDLVETMKSRIVTAGYSVDTAHDGMTGVKMAKEKKPNLILLDIMMPGIDGFETLKRLKEDDITIPSFRREGIEVNGKSYIIIPNRKKNLEVDGSFPEFILMDESPTETDCYFTTAGTVSFRGPVYVPTEEKELEDIHEERDITGSDPLPSPSAAPSPTPTPTPTPTSTPTATPQPTPAETPWVIRPVQNARKRIKL